MVRPRVQILVPACDMRRGDGEGGYGTYHPHDRNRVLCTQHTGTHTTARHLRIGLNHPAQKEAAKRCPALLSKTRSRPSSCGHQLTLARGSSGHCVISEPAVLPSVGSARDLHSDPHTEPDREERTRLARHATFHEGIANGARHVPRGDAVSVPCLRQQGRLGEQQSQEVLRTRPLHHLGGVGSPHQHRGTCGQKHHHRAHAELPEGSSARRPRRHPHRPFPCPPSGSGTGLVGERGILRKRNLASSPGSAPAESPRADAVHRLVAGPAEPGRLQARRCRGPRMAGTERRSRLPHSRDRFPPLRLVRLGPPRQSG